MELLSFSLKNGDLPDSLGAVGYEGDSRAVTLRFTGGAAGAVYKLDLMHETTGEKNVLALENDGGTLSVTLDETMAIPAGRYHVQLRTVGDEVRHSNWSRLTVRESIGAAESFSARIPTELEQMEGRLESYASDAAASAAEAEAWAVGESRGQDVPSDAPQSQNSAKYHAEQAAASAMGAARSAETAASAALVAAASALTELYPVKTVTGDPAVFPDGADGLPLKDLTVGITASRDGSGDPTPSEPKPLLPRRQATVLRYGGTESDDPVSITAELDRDVYGGTLDVTTGVLTVTHVRIRLMEGQVPGTNLFWTVSNTTDGNRLLIGLASSSTTSAAWPQSNANLSDGFACSHFKTASYNGASERGTVGAGTLNGTRYLAVGKTEGDPVTGSPAALRAFLSDPANEVYLLFPRTTPQTYRLTPAEVTTLLGENHIVCDAGEVTAAYRRDPTLALRELENAIVAVGGAG